MLSKQGVGLYSPRAEDACGTQGLVLLCLFLVSLKTREREVA